MTLTSEAIREREGDSIRAFVESCSEHFTGRVLDFGCGRSPYRDVIDGVDGEYVGYDRVAFPANVSGEDIGPVPSGLFNAILCTQSAQYWPEPVEVLGRLVDLLVDGGVLVMTYPTSWDEVEPEDFWRFTCRGMELLLREVGFSVERHERRAEVKCGGFTFPLGYGVVARA